MKRESIWNFSKYYAQVFMTSKKKSHSFKVQTHVEFFTEYFLVFIVIVEKELKWSGTVEFITFEMIWGDSMLVFV